MPFLDNSFDGTYAIEATCHARHLENPYREIFRTLKPGAYFACYEWLTTEKYNEENLAHKKIIHDLEEGNSISKLYSIEECVEAIRSVGFEIIEMNDLANPKNYHAKQEPWFSTLEGSLSLNLDSVYRLPMHPLGRLITNYGLYALEKVKLVPEGTHRVSQVLNKGADALVAAGKEELFTPMFFFLARKPLPVDQ